jgi:hypothetical protein
MNMWGGRNKQAASQQQQQNMARQQAFARQQMAMLQQQSAQQQALARAAHEKARLEKEAIEAALEEKERLYMDDFFSNKFDFTIPLGNNCIAANGLAISEKRKFKLPFDWLQVQRNECNMHEIYTKLITRFKNDELNLDSIVKNCEGNFTIKLDICDLWIPHEPKGSTIEGVKTNYTTYYRRLLDILNSRNNNILIVLTSSNNAQVVVREIDDHKLYFESMFPGNRYYFLSVNLAKEISYSEELNWLNVVLDKVPKWVTRDGKQVWTDQFLEEVVNIFKNINVSNDLSEI